MTKCYRESQSKKPVVCIDSARRKAAAAVAAAAAAAAAFSCWCVARQKKEGQANISFKGFSFVEMLYFVIGLL